ncbi:MAG: radical SAM protein [Candidatus Coatesbacteria bacterium]|nr:radical SAM protein [Candidatus Coatesbacteria bacterium]
MKPILLVTPTPFDISAFGIRALSAYLKHHGFKTRIVFFPGGINNYRHTVNYVYRYPEKVISQLIELSQDSEIAGFSFMSLYYDRGLQLTRGLRSRFGGKIIWGGVHTMVNIESSLNEVDAVCIGEGEEAILALARQLPFENVPNLAYKKDGLIKYNNLAPLLQDVDNLPYCDIDTEGHFIYMEHKKEIVPLTEETYKYHAPRISHTDGKRRICYRLMTTRGCPHSCSYCINNLYHKLYKNQMHSRRRSVDNIIKEMKLAIDKYPWYSGIQFFDDTFFATPFKYLEELVQKYKEEINLPIYAQTSPATLTEQKIDLLIDAGLMYLEMGIQTTSSETEACYERQTGTDRIRKSIQILNTRKEKMLAPRYHIILDNPWETEEALLTTLETILKLPQPYDTCLSSLTFFHGTPLYERAKKEGLIKDEELEINRHPFGIPKGDYLNFLIYLACYSLLPKGIIRKLATPRYVKYLHKDKFNKFYNSLYFWLERLRFLEKGLKAVFSGRLFGILFHLKQRIGVGW